MYQNPETAVLELAKVLGHLTSAILAIAPAKLHCCFRTSSVTKQKISIGASLVVEKHRNIQWKDLNSSSRSSCFTDRCFTHRLGCNLRRNENWRDMERRMHINELELLGLKLALDTFLKAQEIKSLHIQMDNIMTLITS